MDGPRPRDKRARSPSAANLLWTPEVKRDIDNWRRTEQFPFPDMPLHPHISVQTFSVTDLRLIHHVSAISHDLQARGASQFVIWTDKIPTYVFSPSDSCVATLWRCMCARGRLTGWADSFE